VDDMPVDELKNFLLLHFIQGNMIFTDGSSEAGYYETTCLDEKSTQYTKIYTKIYVQTGVDQIVLPDKDGNVYLQVDEADDKTNILTSVQTGTGHEVFPSMYNNAVIHEVDKALIKDELDTH
jgi:hypothetical protein